MKNGLKTYVAQTWLTLWVGLALCASSMVFSAESATANQLENIDFRVNKEKAAVLIVELASPSAVVDVQKVQEGLSIELLKTDVADDKLYLLDVKDFSTPVESVEVFRKEPSTQLVVTVDGEFQHDYTP